MLTWAISILIHGAISMTAEPSRLLIRHGPSCGGLRDAQSDDRPLEEQPFRLANQPSRKGTLSGVPDAGAAVDFNAKTPSGIPLFLGTSAGSLLSRRPRDLPAQSE